MGFWFSISWKTANKQTTPALCHFILIKLTWRKKDKRYQQTITPEEERKKGFQSYKEEGEKLSLARSTKLTLSAVHTFLLEQLGSFICECFKS